MLPQGFEGVVTARWIFPVSGPALENGAIRVRSGRVVDVARAGSLPADLDLGPVAVVPGLVNSHTHIDLSILAGKTPPQPDFLAWLSSLIAYRLTSEPPTREAIDAAAIEAMTGMVGTVLVGDIDTGDDALADRIAERMEVVSFFELRGRTAEQEAASRAGLSRWQSGVGRHPRAIRGLAPHAPYSTRPSLYRLASEIGLPVAIHLAETREEVQLTETRSGPFVPFIDRLGGFVPENVGGTIREILDTLSGVPRLLVVHGNYLDPEIELPANATVVYCPRTHAAFGHDPHPFRRFLERGIPVALGTDSLASNPDLNVWNEAVFLRKLYPALPASALLEMITIRGAEALCRGMDYGSIEPGKLARFHFISWTDDRKDPFDQPRAV